MPIDAWAGSGFNGWARSQRRTDPHATHVCEPCLFVTSRISPVPGRPPKEGKKYGGNYRNYSHGAAVLPDGSIKYMNASKGEQAELLAFILEPGGDPWSVAIAVSGQKHVIPYAAMNGPSDICVVAFEEQVLRISRIALTQMTATMNALRASSGCSAEALATGQYHGKDLARDLEGIREFEREHGHLRGGGFFEVAAFLTSKAET